jgi:hypothetical protein
MNTNDEIEEQKAHMVVCDIPVRRDRGSTKYLIYTVTWWRMPHTGTIFREAKVIRQDVRGLTLCTTHRGHEARRGGQVVESTVIDQTRGQTDGSTRHCEIVVSGILKSEIQDDFKKRSSGTRDSTKKSGASSVPFTCIIILAAGRATS